MHLQKWIEHSYADYYTMFINSWIPFNAWYHETYYDEQTCKTDKLMVEQVKNNDNKSLLSRLEIIGPEKARI